MVAGRLAEATIAKATVLKREAWFGSEAEGEWCVRRANGGGKGQVIEFTGVSGSMQAMMRSLVLHLWKSPNPF
jgi:hypothetical protein